MDAALGFMPTFVSDPETLQRVAQGQPLTFAHIPRGLADQCPDGHIKVVDATMKLKAVLKIRPDDMSYDYCCVFN
jgi:hypothetical protein